MISGTFEKVFYFELLLFNDVEEEINAFSNVNCIKIFFSREEKMAMHKNNALDIILKLFRKSIEYNFLIHKLSIMWKTIEGFDMIDLGNIFFKVSFQNKGDFDRVLGAFQNRGYLDRVLGDGSWFIGSTFLTMKFWEPKFKATKATFSVVAIWIRIPLLFSEYYELMSLEKFGNKV